MIAKKTKSANLENKRFAFFQIGLIIVGAVTLVAFEYTTLHEKKKEVELQNDGPLMSSIDVYDDVVDKTAIPQTQNTVVIPVIGEMIDSVIITSAPMPVIGGPTGPITIIVEDPQPPGIIGLPEPIEPMEIYEVVSQEPKFPGGDAAMRAFIGKHVVYPDMAREMGVEGTVYVEFVVNTDGSIQDVVSKNKLNKDLETEAKRVVNMMPKWEPGEQAGKKVRVRYVIPINFVIKK